MRSLNASATRFQAGLQAALLLIAVSFVLSTLVIVVSPLARLRALPQPVAA